MVGILAVAAALVSVRAPAEAVPAAAPPPARTGPVLHLGGLAGHLTVGAAMSAGQLRLTVATPSTDDGDRTPLDVRAMLRRGTGRAAPVRLDPCGYGCFAAPVYWTGSASLTVDAATDTWNGDRVVFDVPWPLPPAQTALARTFDTMAKVERFTLDEQVTSDTTRPNPPAARLVLAGKEFLSAEPYLGQLAGRRPPGGTEGRLRFAFGVADKYYVDLTLDGQGRVYRQVLISRTT